MKTFVLVVCAVILLLLVPAAWALSQARHAIHLAAITYRVSEPQMIRVARCETGGTFSPRAYNRSSGASGLFQFLHGTWLGTPYAREDVFDPYANALAAAWLVRQDGGWREWACAP